MNAEQLLELLDRNLPNASALRCLTRLGPAGGSGDKVFPPTYAGTKKGEFKYATETRYIDGEAIKVVLIDSVQSQANRIEEALQDAADAGEIDLPIIAVEVSGYGRVTSLQAPHRVYDATFRDSTLDGVRFRESELGKQVVAARFHNATALFETCPTILLFGGWDSHAGNVERSAKLQRALTSEIIGLHATQGVRTAGRVDPLGIKRGAGPVYQHKDPHERWTLDPAEAETAQKGKAKSGEALKFKDGRPSEIGHSNIAPGVTDGGFTISEARQIAVLSIPQLRRLRFPDHNTGEINQARNHACRLVLASLAIYGLSLQTERGYDLRSRCVLIPLESPTFELLGRTTNEVERFSLEADIARETLALALDRARALGATWVSGTTLLAAQTKLEELVRRSALLATSDDEE